MPKPKRTEIISVHSPAFERVIKAFRYNDRLTHKELVSRAKLDINEQDRVLSRMLGNGDLTKVGEYPNRFYICPAAKREV